MAEASETKTLVFTNATELHNWFEDQLPEHLAWPVSLEMANIAFSRGFFKNDSTVHTTPLFKRWDAALFIEILETACNNIAYASCNKCGNQLTYAYRFENLPCNTHCCGCCPSGKMSSCPKETKFGTLTQYLQGI